MEVVPEVKYGDRGSLSRVAAPGTKCDNWGGSGTDGVPVSTPIARRLGPFGATQGFWMWVGRCCGENRPYGGRFRVLVSRQGE